jgi:hypothetical protein
MFLQTNFFTQFHRILSNVVSGTPVEMEEVQEIRKFFETEAGRRRFVFILRSKLKKARTTILNDNGFEILLYLLSACVYEMDNSPK